MEEDVKPFSQACENNKEPILCVLRRVFEPCRRVMEIGSGTGQHACWFASHLDHLKWQPTDVSQNLAGIELWRASCPSPNLLPALTFDIRDPEWPAPGCDGVFSANTAHIMSWPLACEMIERVADNLPAGGVFALYGPFNYHGTYTSDSNRDFDQWLKEADPERGIRDFEKVDQLALSHGLHLFEDNPMPANNRLLVWVKRPQDLI